MKILAKIHRLFLIVMSIVCIALPLRAEPFRIIVTHLEPPLVPNSVMDLALELGYFEREGVSVELVRVQQTPSAISALLSGEGEMANVGVDTVLQLKVQGQDSFVAVLSPNKSLPFIIASKSEFQSITDLKGHSFGVGRIGSLDHSLSSKVIEDAGVSMKDVDLVSLGQPSVRAQALMAGKIDATTVSIGTWMSIADKRGLKILVPSDQYYEAAPVMSKINIMPKSVLSERRSEVMGVIRALIKISRDFDANPEDWAKAMAPYATSLSEEDLKQLAKSFSGSWSVNGGLNKEALSYTSDWLFKTEDFKGADPVMLSDWVDFTPVDEVLAELGTLSSSDFVSR
jgi:NitT/TauT family transport system substrate-binding protein